jgi:hypothetical protein
MRTRAITAMTALVTLVAVGACSKSDNGNAMDSTTMAPATTTTTSPGVADSSMAGMSTSTTPMTHADSLHADSLRADSLKRADSTTRKP